MPSPKFNAEDAKRGKDGVFGGWNPDTAPESIEACINDPLNLHPVFGAGAAAVMKDYEKRDTYLWETLIACKPGYRRGNQAIGSCVGWGLELALTTNCAKQAVKKRQKKNFVEVSTEACYGGARCEGRGKDFAGWQDGANGSYAAKFARDYGAVLRKDWSKKTGNAEHDLREYDGKKEKNWGAYGCGGQHDKGKLDAIAKEYPCKTISQIRDFDEAAACIAGSKCPVTIASMYGCSMKRNKYGECGWTKSWAHQMELSSVRFGSRPGLWCNQSWGPQVASGPSGDEYCENIPGGQTPKNILGFGWWIPAEVCDRIFKSGDCWGIGDVDGWRIDRFDYSRLC